MCGIAGILRKEGANPEDVGHLREMLLKQTHRGPDASDISSIPYGTLGHNRLSIIDLSSHANQPFTYEHVTLVFNGEIYNYLEIKNELERERYLFRTSSDTEVVCAAYLKWGQKCVERFVGMWSFALWDDHGKKLFCSRDRFGIKPFNYIHENNGALSFASEIRTLSVLPWFDGGLNRAQIARGLNLGLAGYKDETYFSGVKQLPGSHNLIWQNGKLEVYRYWDLKKVQVPTILEDAILGFKEHFLNSISLHMRSDVPIGANLSGGLDSASIVSVLGANYPKVDFKTFTIYYGGENGVDERPFARTLSEKYSNIQSFYLEPKDDDLQRSFNHFLDHADVPPAGSSFYSQYFVMKLAAENGMKVLLNGQGSDEYTIGYLHSFYHVFADELRKMQLGDIIRDFNSLKSISGKGMGYMLKSLGLGLWSGLVSPNAFARTEFVRKYPQVPEGDYSSSAFSLEKKFDSRLDNFLYHLLMTTTLPTLLHYEDRNSMAFSIESRVPFLDHRLVEYGFSLPVDFRIRPGKTKYILREALKEYLPHSIYDRRDKKGFVTPGEISWVNGPLKDDFRSDMSKNAVYSWRMNTLRGFKNKVS